MPNMYLVVAVKESSSDNTDFGYATMYSSFRNNHRERILEDIKGAVGVRIEELYNGNASSGAIKAISNISEIEQIVEIQGRKMLAPELERIMDEVESVPSKIILVQR